MIKEGVTLPHTDCQGTVEGPRVMDRIIAGEPKKKFWEESRVTPQKFFGHGGMRDRENL